MIVNHIGRCFELIDWLHVFMYIYQPFINHANMVAVGKKAKSSLGFEDVFAKKTAAYDCS